jgi:DNA-binding NarL/FixJ family response regulator
MISVLIADKNYLSRLGLFTLLNESPNFEVDYTCEDNFDVLIQIIKKQKPKILVLDFQSLNFSIQQISNISKTFKKLQILAITDFLAKNVMQDALDNGVRSYLLKECDKEEIIEALHATYNNERFLCGKVAFYLTSNENYGLLKPNIDNEWLEKIKRENQ